MIKALHRLNCVTIKRQIIDSNTQLKKAYVKIISIDTYN